MQPSSPWAPSRASTPTSPPGTRRASSTPSPLLHDTEESEPPVLWHSVGGSTAAVTPPWTRPARLDASAPKTPSSSTAGHRERMPANVDEVQDAVDEGVRLKWLSTIVRHGGRRLTIERMELDADGFPQPTGEVEDFGRTR